MFLYTKDKRKHASVSLFYRHLFEVLTQDGVVCAFKNLIGHHCEGDFIEYFVDFYVFCDNYRRNIKFYLVRYSAQ